MKIKIGGSRGKSWEFSNVVNVSIKNDKDVGCVVICIDKADFPPIKIGIQSGTIRISK